MQRPALYSFVDKEQLKDMIQCFQNSLDLPIQVLDYKGTPLLTSGESASFCNKFQSFLPAGDTCQIIHSNAGKKAISLGESYIFSCPANLNHIIFPLLHDKDFIGSILVGPFLMDKPDSSLFQNIADRYEISTGDLFDLYDESGFIKVIPPSIVTQVSKLLYYMFSNLIPDNKLRFIINNEKLYQQSKINESIQKYKFYDMEGRTSYPFDLEKELITKVKTGSVKEAKGILNELLGYVFFSEGNSLDIIKSRSVELCSLLSRAAIEGGAETNNILKINNNYLKIITEISDFEDLCYKLQEIVEAFSESMFYTKHVEQNGMIKKSINYIAKNFDKNITLNEVAKEVHLNPSYFSSVFKQSTGSSFTEYLNMVRIEESKRLLGNTDISIIDIAVSTGFESQSYFSKVFKKYTGLTPSQYR